MQNIIIFERLNTIHPADRSLKEMPERQAIGRPVYALQSGVGPEFLQKHAVCGCLLANH